MQVIIVAIMTIIGDSMGEVIMASKIEAKHSWVAYVVKRANVMEAKKVGFSFF